MTPLRTYLVTVGTPNGPGTLEVPTTLGPEAAGRRAFFTAASIGWGDLEELQVLHVEEEPRAEEERDLPELLVLCRYCPTDTAGSPVFLPLAEWYRHTFTEHTDSVAGCAIAQELLRSAGVHPTDPLQAQADVIHLEQRRAAR